MIEYSRIVNECFWDLNFCEKDIEAILKGYDSGLRKFLFGKILENSTRLLFDMRPFPKQEIEELLKGIVIPRFNGEYLARRKNTVEVFFLDKPLEIEELKWPV